jgi:hypothetical protein
MIQITKIASSTSRKLAIGAPEVSCQPLPP